MPKRLLKKLPDILAVDPGKDVFFFDEGRFGFQPVTGRVWAQKGLRPVTTIKPGYKNFYVYSSVCPKTGEEISLFLPWVNTNMMNLYLAHLSAELGCRRCFLIMDRAGWHSSSDLEVPKNIEIILLPPYSPELNPVERLFQWLKRHSLRNRLHQGIEDMMDAVQACLSGATTDFFRDLCRCSYLLH
jgi:transposase